MALGTGRIMMVSHLAALHETLHERIPHPLFEVVCRRAPGSSVDPSVMGSNSHVKGDWPATVGPEYAPSLGRTPPELGCGAAVTRSVEWSVVIAAYWNRNFTQGHRIGHPSTVAISPSKWLELSYLDIRACETEMPEMVAPVRIGGLHERLHGPLFSPLSRKGVK